MYFSTRCKEHSADYRADVNREDRCGRDCISCGAGIESTHSNNIVMEAGESTGGQMDDAGCRLIVKEPVWDLLVPTSV